MMVSSHGIATKFLVLSEAEPKDLTDFGFSEDEIAHADEATLTAVGDVAWFVWTGAVPAAWRGHILAVGDNVLVRGNVNIRRLSLVNELYAPSTVTITLAGSTY